MITDIANALREGATNKAIWDYRTSFNTVYRRIESTQDAMHDAVTVLEGLPQLVAALGWALDQIEDDLDPDHQAAFAAARATFAKFNQGEAA